MATRGARAADGPDDPRLVHASLLLDRYSLEISDLVDSVVGTGSSGNHEVQVLVHLFRAGPSRPHELMEVTGLTRTNVARLVERLERMGLVQRAHGDRDRRTIFTSLTPTGRQRLGALDQALDAFFAESAPAVDEILALLGAKDPVRTRREPELALVIAQQMADAGAPYARRLADEVGVSGRSQRLVLGALATWGQARPGALAEVVGLSSGGTTNLLDQLETDGIVERRYGAVADDRRAVVVTLSERGREAAARMAAILRDHLDDIVAALLGAKAARTALG